MYKHSIRFIYYTRVRYNVGVQITMLRSVVTGCGDLNKINVYSNAFMKSFEKKKKNKVKDFSTKN